MCNNRDIKKKKEKKDFFLMVGSVYAIINS